MARRVRAISGENFAMPSGVVRIPIDPASGLLATRPAPSPEDLAALHAATLGAVAVTAKLLLAR